MRCNSSAVPSRSQLNRVAVLICIPAVFCSLSGVLGNHDGNNIKPPMQLRRCVSLSSCMNHNSKSLDSIGYNRRIAVYSPVHSPPTELVQNRPQWRESKPRHSNIDSSNSLHRAIQERREDPTEVFTKIQTQLYPHMRF